MSLNQSGETARQFAIREPGGKVFGDFALTEPFERHLDTELMKEKFLLECPERTFGARHGARSVTPEKKQLGRFTATGQRRNDVERGMIRPMEIFQDQNQASVRRYNFQRFTYLAHHPLASGPENLLLKGLPLICFDQRRKLYQPGRSAKG